MQLGEVWAYRDRPSDSDCPLIPAELLQLGPPRSQKVRVRWQGGEYPGLDQWISQRRLVVPWDDAEAWLRDERLFELTRQASLNVIDSVEHRAAWETIFVHPMPDGILLGYDRRDGATVDIQDLDAVSADLGLDREELLSKPLAFLNREGHYIAPWSVAKRIALRIAERYPELVLAHIAKEEKDLQDKAVHGYTYRWSRKDPEYFVPPERSVERLRKEEPVFQLVREWCGAAAVERFDELAGLREEVVRLRELVEKAANRITDLGSPRIAKNLLADMNRAQERATDR